MVKFEWSVHWKWACGCYVVSLEGELYSSQGIRDEIKAPSRYVCNSIGRVEISFGENGRFRVLAVATKVAKRVQILSPVMAVNPLSPTVTIIDGWEYMKVVYLNCG